MIALIIFCNVKLCIKTEPQNNTSLVSHITRHNLENMGIYFYIKTTFEY
jgi:hypothetical protein